MPDININLSRLAECRNRLGLTKQQAAEKLGMTQPTYLRYENGDRSPSVYTIKAIAEGLGTSVDYLTNKTDDPSPDCYIVRKDTNLDLFLLIERCQSDNDLLSRLISYEQKIKT